MKGITLEKLQELENNPEFLAAIEQAATDADKAKVLANFGITVTEDELKQALTAAQAMLKEHGYVEADGELTLKGLELVSGGRKGRVGATVGILGALMFAGGLAMTGPIGLGLLVGGGELVFGGVGASMRGL